MARYIDVEEVKKFFDEKDAGSRERGVMLLTANEFLEHLDEIPAADVQKVKHGIWKYSSDGAAFCTACKTKTDPRNYGYPYCNMCGARMNGKE